MNVQTAAALVGAFKRHACASTFLDRREADQSRHLVVAMKDIWARLDLPYAA